MLVLKQGIFWSLALVLAGLGCDTRQDVQGKVGMDDETRFRAMREKMVLTQIENRGVKDPRVLNALRKVPRHLFVRSDMKERAYDDNALPIAEGQTISQPYIVGIMTELVAIGPEDRVLEVGTGSGYQAAVLGELAKAVYSIEILEPLATASAQLLHSLGYDHVKVRHGDGYRGWPEEAPFDAIVVTAVPDHIPQPLVDQLKVGGRMVIPVGREDQELRLLVKTKEGVRQKQIISVRFVPMTGEAQEDDR
ncbi:MAG: protein-L-isoaspartate(D-aspartate) O-methyltransferase [bacterium]|nr:protein-L-isoaspartate(D-aspartate) O-methyltransferase [bacterium]